MNNSIKNIHLQNNFQKKYKFTFKNYTSIVKKKNLSTVIKNMDNCVPHCFALFLFLKVPDESSHWEENC